MTVLITGASSGIGLAFAKVFAQEGHDLVLVARRRERLEAIKTEIESTTGRDVLVVIEDLSLDGSAQRLVSALGNKQIDVLVNNAGSGDTGLFAETSLEKTQSMMQLNMSSLVALTRLLLPSMIERGKGGVLNVASIAAFVPGPTMSVYFASKAFVLSFSEALANELHGSGVSVTTVCPGATSTEFDRQAGTYWGDDYHKGLPTAQVVAEFGYKAFVQGKQLAIHGQKNRLLLLLARFLPHALIANVVRKML